MFVYLFCPAFLVDGKINFEIEGFPVLGISGASNPKQVHPSMTQGGRGRCEDEEKREGGRPCIDVWRGEHNLCFDGIPLRPVKDD